MMGPRHESATVSTTGGPVSVLILLGPRLRSRPFPWRAITVKGWALLCASWAGSKRLSPTEVEEGFYALGLEGILRREGRTYEEKPPACCVSGGGSSTSPVGGSKK